MYEVTQDYLNAIASPVRRIHGKVQIDYTDPLIDQSITITVSENNRTSHPQQVADNIRTPSGKYATLGTWQLGDDHVLAPANPADGQMGWWGSQLSDASGNFTTPYPTLTAEFFSRPIYSLLVVGDSLQGEYPVDFTVKLYSGETLKHTETVTGNTEVEWTKEIAKINEITKMVLTVTKWSHAGRCVKILEFITSIQETYEGDDIIGINLLEEREVSQGSLPIGNISANEIDIRLNNESRKFDAGNSKSPLYQLLKANRRIKAWLGVETWLATVYIPLGTFWSGDWDAPEGELYASTTGRDRLELLRQTTYSNSTVQTNKTLYELAIAVLADAGLTATEYWVDTELQDYAVPYSYFTSQSHREALRKIAEACLGQVYCDREGIIRIEGPSYLQAANEPVLTITQDDYFAKSNPVKWSEIANYIEVETQPLRPDTEQEMYRSNDPVPIGAGQTKTITAYYNESPCVDAAASIEGTGTVTEATYYAWGATVKVTSAAAGEFTLVINAKPLKVLNKEKAIAQDAQSIVDNGKIRYEFPSNPLVQTLAVAQAIADGLLQFANPRRDVSLDWRGNPAVLLGDKVAIVDRQETANYFVTRQELEFDGTLRAKLEGRKA